jgi:signal transduction histidine kinase
VTLNLISNAIKFTFKGYVMISVAYKEELSSLFVEIKDTGIGISKER